MTDLNVFLTLTLTLTLTLNPKPSLHQLGESMTDLKILGLVGGNPRRLQGEILTLQEGGVQVVVGSPSRIYEMIRRRILICDAVKMVPLLSDRMGSLLISSRLINLFSSHPLLL
jgi:superfamily II DNA/RNA helicase